MNSNGLIDHFEEETTSHFSFPCSLCIHRHGSDKEMPCRECLHNALAVPKESPCNNN